jgi:hypothetical protein
MGFQDYKGMRPQKNRSRGRGHNPNNPNNPNRPRGPHRQQTFDSNGPNVKIRGSAYQVFERYIALAREASASGDRIAAENFYQHAEHYYRIMTANGEHYGQAPRPTTPADQEMGMGEPDQPQQQGYGPPQHQPHGQGGQPQHGYEQPQQHGYQQVGPDQGRPTQPEQPHDPASEPQPY